ncbi:BON domain-containing protein [Roseiconus lacunae]|uniref:BON domain-containing protein n=1 Tax=Roseiconus lacunae TaxID=2605694 RepID=A0ABT7PPZ5_9BACT|nr:BON domain-containing protein [Roseiconus lacunae]MCD0461871.1 BON domain-containing protein [Roseiconus lacunae]MDM4018582.1 BON domain-containing protein [Roseiconus lacunae]
MRQFPSSIALLGLIIAPFAVSADEPASRPVPDLKIELDVRDGLKSNFNLLSPDIHARVIAGRVELRGQVPSFADRIEVQDAVEDLAGVRSVQNRLRINRSLDTINRRSRELVSIRSRVQSDVMRSQIMYADVVKLPAKLMPVKQNVRGMIEVVAGDHLMIRDFRHGLVDTEVSATASITLDGQPADEDVLRKGFLVLAEVAEVDGDLIAQSVEAHSPK